MSQFLVFTLLRLLGGVGATLLDRPEGGFALEKFLVQSIINKLFTYRIVVESYEEQIKQYMDMKSDNDAVKAI